MNIKMGLVGICCLANLLYADGGGILYEGFYKNQSINEIQKIVDLEKDNVLLESNSEIYKKVSNSNDEMYFNFKEGKLKDIYLVNNHNQDVSEKDITTDEKDFVFNKGIVNQETFTNKEDYIKEFDNSKNELNNDIIKKLNTATLYKNNSDIELTILNRCVIEEKPGSCLQCNFVKKENTKKEMNCITTKLYKTK